MTLKFKPKTKDEIPAEVVNLYVERDGAWLLDVDGPIEKAKLEEFRATNVALMKERDELKRITVLLLALQLSPRLLDEYRR